MEKHESSTGQGRTFIDHEKVKIIRQLRQDHPEIGMNVHIAPGIQHTEWPQSQWNPPGKADPRKISIYHQLSEIH